MSHPLRRVFVGSFTTANSAGTEIFDLFRNLKGYQRFTVLAEMTGPTGGTLDIYLQRRVTTNKWVDWAHFTQVAATATRDESIDMVSTDLTVSTPGVGTDAAPGVALAAATFTGGHPGDEVRVIAVSGAGTTLGAAQVVTVMATRDAY